MLNNLRRKVTGLLGSDRHDEIVVVSGLPRSGTSLMMKMLEAGGIAPVTDQLRDADNDNPKGYYEYERVKALSSGDTAWLSEARGKAIKIIATLLEFVPTDHAYRVIFMRRPMPEVLASQRTMLVNRGEDPDAVGDQAMARLFRDHLDRLEPVLAARPELTMLHVDYHDLLGPDAVACVERIDNFIGRRLDTAAMVAVVDPDLYRQRQGS